MHFLRIQNLPGLVDFGKRIVFTSPVFFTLVLAAFSANAEPVAKTQPPLLQLQTFNLKESPSLSGWVYSEKLDGVRAYWNGKVLTTKNGTRLNPPQGFIDQLPPFALDGELWTRRGDFENIVSIVRSNASKKRWNRLFYYVFEVPNQPGDLMMRMQTLKTYLKVHPAKQLRRVEQHSVTSLDDLLTVLDQVVEQGGEGLVVRDPTRPYETGRSKFALKLKKHEDDECQVTGYKPGKGKLQGQVGALQCQLKNGQIIFLGSGLKARDRQSPPKIGEQVTFKYYGKTSKGLPRFPVFMRVRPLETQQ